MHAGKPSWVMLSKPGYHYLTGNKLARQYFILTIADYLMGEVVDLSFAAEAHAKGVSGLGRATFCPVPHSVAG